MPSTSQNWVRRCTDLYLAFTLARERAGVCIATTSVSVSVRCNGVCVCSTRWSNASLEVHSIRSCIQGCDHEKKEVFSWSLLQLPQVVTGTAYLTPTKLAAA